MSEPRQIICDESVQSTAFVKKLSEETKMLCDMVSEMFVSTPQALLSPVMRRMLVDKAAEVNTNLSKVHWHLHVDWPEGGKSPRLLEWERPQ